MLGIVTSCGWNPNFHSEGYCLITDGNNSFVSLMITVDTVTQTYFLHQNISGKGSNKICLNNIPEGYALTLHRDTIYTNNIPIEEGQILYVNSSGGDRSAIKHEFVVQNGQLVMTK